MAKKASGQQVSKHFLAIWHGILEIGRWVGARRTLFIWSAISFSVSAYFGIVQAISLYQSNFVLDMNAFVLTQLFNILFMFLKLFMPMMLLIIAIKYIFDDTQDGKSSRVFRMTFVSAAVAAFIIAVLYYLNAGHLIGNNSSAYCAEGMVCWFGWSMLFMFIKAFVGYFIGIFLVLLGMRNIYDEITFMLKK